MPPEDFAVPDDFQRGQMLAQQLLVTSLFATIAVILQGRKGNVFLERCRENALTMLSLHKNEPETAKLAAEAAINLTFDQVKIKVKAG